MDSRKTNVNFEDCGQFITCAFSLCIKIAFTNICDVTRNAKNV
ncbi:hypothetical protein T09_15013 [Trichinella sp. T9]|nr:hypothetical protein T09_15013 [Trichinella sp. T9]